MKSVPAHEANRHFSALLSEVEGGEEIVVTKQGTPVAILKPVTPPERTLERKEAIVRLREMLDRGLPWPDDFEMPSRAELHERAGRDR